MTKLAEFSKSDNPDNLKRVDLFLSYFYPLMSNLIDPEYLGKKLPSKHSILLQMNILESFLSNQKIIAMIKLHNIGEMFAAVLNGTKRPNIMTHVQAQTSETHRKRLLSILINLSQKAQVSEPRIKMYDFLDEEEGESLESLTFEFLFEKQLGLNRRNYSISNY